MSDQSLHDLLSEMVSAYTEKNKPQTIPSPAEIGTHMHPLLKRLCEEAEKHQASDIFISAGFPPALKVNGKLTPMRHPALTAADTAEIAESTMNDEQIDEFNINLEVNYSIQSPSNTRYRVNAYHDQGCAGMVLRRINPNVPTLEALGLPELFQSLALKPRGLIVFAGPTSSGKSTSLAALLNHRNQKVAGHIITLEDPIKYIFQPRRSIITQRELGIDTPNWQTAVENIMRQSPDVVSIGEIRNAQSMEYALQLAQTGHLCLCTLHANNATQAIERIINFYPEGRRSQVLMDIALNTIALIGQRLVVKKDLSGRMAIIDLLVNTPAMQDLISQGKLIEAKNLMERSSNDGMQTFDQHLMKLFSDGLIDYDEALRQADSPHNLKMQIQLHQEGERSDFLFDRISDLNLM